MTTLHIFALNTDLELRHTHLTRARGEAPNLPHLASWLGVERVASGEIELFPVNDLGDMRLSDYIAAAFAPERDIAGETRGRIDALSGAVLLAPDTALSGPPKPRGEATLIASLPLARADHSAELPPAELGDPVTPPPVDRPAPPPRPRRGSAVWMLLALIAAAALILVIL